MNYKYILTAILIASLFCGTASAWLSGYDHRMPITVNNGGASELTYYQFNFTNDTNVLVAAGHMQASGADCRITDASDNLLPFWNETPFNAAGTKIWVNATTLAVGDNTFYMYYGNSGASSVANGINTFIFHDTDFALSASAVRHPDNPIMSYNVSLPHEDKMVRSPSVLYDEEEGIWKMWYMSGNDTGNYVPSISYATSPDGVVWTKYAGNPVLVRNESIWYESGGPRAPSVMKINSSMYYMYYSARDGTYGTGCSLEFINLATSSDGITWNRSLNNPIISNTTSNPNGLTFTNNISEPTVRYYNGTWYMLHSLQPDTGGWKQALSMSSDHDKNWHIEKWTVDKSAECPNEAGHAPSILGIKNGTNPALVNGKFWQVHSCWGGSTNTKLKYRSSPDLINWTDEGTLLAPSENGIDWDQEETHFGDWILDENDTAWLFYSGVNTSSDKHWQEGLAQIEHFTDFTTGEIWKNDPGYSLSHESDVVHSAPYSLKGISTSDTWLYGWRKFPNQTDTFIIEWWGASANNTTTQQFGISAVSPPDRQNSIAGYWDDDEYISSFNGTQTVWMNNYTPDTWYKFKLIVRTGSDIFDVYLNDNSTPMQTDCTMWGSFSGMASSFYMRGNNHDAQYIDDIFIRKYASPEPTTTLGAEETGGGGCGAYNITLPPGWSIIGWTSPTPTTAHSMGGLIGSNCTFVTERNATTGEYVTHVMAGAEDEDNFAINRGWGYFVKLSAETLWERDS